MARFFFEKIIRKNETAAGLFWLCQRIALARKQIMPIFTTQTSNDDFQKH